MTSRHRAALATLAVLLLPACASSGGSDTEGGTVVEDWVVQGSATETVNVTNRTRQTEAVLAYPVDAVWEALQAAYEELEFPVSTRVPADGLLGAEEFRFRGLDGERPSRSLDCGDSATGPFADQSYITLNVMSQVRPSGTGAVLTTEVRASARARDRASGERFCRSRGRIEAALVGSVQARLES